MKYEHVYFAKADRYIKIGRSSNVNKRLESLQVCCPHEIKIMKTILCPKKTPSLFQDNYVYNCIELERALHEAFIESHVRGEWYLYEGTLKSMIDGLSLVEESKHHEFVFTYTRNDYLSKMLFDGLDYKYINYCNKRKRYVLSLNWIINFSNNKSIPNDVISSLKCCRSCSHDIYSSFNSSQKTMKTFIEEISNSSIKPEMFKLGIDKLNYFIKNNSIDIEEYLDLWKREFLPLNS